MSNTDHSMDPDEEVSKPIIVIDVTLGPSMSSKLIIKESDRNRIERIVENFCVSHNLTQDKQEKLL